MNEKLISVLTRRRDFVVSTRRGDDKNWPGRQEILMLDELLVNGVISSGRKHTLRRRIDWLASRVAISGRRFDDSNYYDALELQALQCAASVSGLTELLVSAA